MGTGVVAGKEIIATFIGAQDQAGNLLTPNPATVTFVKGSADGVAPTVGAITQTGATTFSIKFSEELQTAPTVTYGSAPTTVTKDTTDATVYNVTTATTLDGAKTVVVSGFTDLSGEVGTTTSKVVTFVKDAAAPVVTSSAVVKDETDGFEYLELTFDKIVVLANSSLVATATTNGSYVKDFVTTPIANAELVDGPITYKSPTNKKVIRVKLDTLLGTKDVKDATYTLNLALADVKSIAAVAIASATVTFTRGEDGVAPNSTVLGAPTVTADATDNNKVNVSFPSAVDGASAINSANYQIDGVVVEFVTLKPLDGGAQVAVLNLKADSNTFTGVRNINISGVKALGSSKMMVPFFTNAVILKENVAPTVTSAKLTATNKVTLTFSEAVVTTANATDFSLVIGGSTVGTTVRGVAKTATANATTVEYTLNNHLTAEQIASGLSLKPINATINITDIALNKLSVPTNITITQ